MFHTVSIIGGDLRQLTVGKELKKEGFHVFLHGFDKYTGDTELDEDELDFILCSDIIVLPVPVTFDGCVINSPFSDSPLPIDELLDAINPSALVFGGQIKPNLQNALNEKSIKYCDYLTREELAVRNAVPAALCTDFQYFNLIIILVPVHRIHHSIMLSAAQRHLRTSTVYDYAL